MLASKDFRKEVRGVREVTPVAVSTIKAKDTFYGWDGVRNTTATSGGNVYGYVKNGIVTVNGWIKLSSSAAKGSVVATGLPPCSKNTNILCYDETSDSCYSCYIRGGATQLILDYNPTNHIEHFLDFMGVYLLLE